MSTTSTSLFLDKDFMELDTSLNGNGKIVSPQDFVTGVSVPAVLRYNLYPQVPQRRSDIELLAQVDMMEKKVLELEREYKDLCARMLMVEKEHCME